MNTHQKDKRTKEQLLQILSNALTQEEQLGEKIKMLENKLAAYQKQQEDAQAEINQHGLSASKESFRIDYYKAAEKGQLKGVIEHLPSRQKKSFPGLGIKYIAHFTERFLPEEAKQQKPMTTLMPPAKANSPVEMDQHPTLLKQDKEASLLTDLKQIREATAAEKVAAMPLMTEQEEARRDAMAPNSRLAQRLRTRFQNNHLKTANQPMESTQTQPPVASPLRSSHTDRVMLKIAAAMPTETTLPETQPQQTADLTVGGKSRLSERLRAELRTGIPEQ